MTDQPQITNDDKLWALLGYVLSPLVPIIVLLMEDKKARPFIKYHNMQALVLGIVNIILAFVLSFTIILICVPMIFWLVMVYWGYKAYQGEYVVIPVVTNFVKKQGWA